MTAFTLEVLDSAGDTLLSFDDNTIVSFKLIESLSGIRPDLESRGLDKNAFFLDQEEQLWSPFASVSQPGLSDTIPRELSSDEGLEPPYRLKIRTLVTFPDLTPSIFTGLSIRLTIGDVVSSPSYVQGTGVRTGVSSPRYVQGTGVRTGVSSPRSVLGTAVSSPRYVHGTIFKAVVMGGAGSAQAAFEFHVCPWIWYLAFSKKSRVMSGNSLDIINTIVGEYPPNLIPSPMLDTSKISSPPPSRDIVTQYQESDYAFMCRLLERDGLFFYVTHDDAGCNVVIGDSNSDFQGDILDVTPIDIHANQLYGSELFSDYVTNLNLTSQIVPEAYRMRDYDPDNASASLDATSPSSSSVLEIFDYPGGFNHLQDGMDNIAPRRAKTLKSFETLCAGFGKHPLFSPGVKVQMPVSTESTIAAEMQGEIYVIRQTVHELARDTYGIAVYNNAFELMPLDNDFSPAPITPTPMINGPMTGIVTTETSGEHIDVDDTFCPMIRYKWDVNFTGIRVRLAQGWAGGYHGMQILPRVGDEVIIQFLDGDIDRPVITGSLYNSASKALFDPTINEEMSAVSGTPGQFRYVSGIHDSGGNKILMYDQFGAERLMLVAAGSRDDVIAERYLLATTDRVDVTKNDKVEDVLNDYTIYIGGNLTVDVVGDIKFTAGGSILSHKAASSDMIERK